VQEAFAFYARVNRQQLASQLQYDYFTAYLSFYTEDQQLARDLSNQYANYPVDRWRNAFAAIAKELAERTPAARPAMFLNIGR